MGVTAEGFPGRLFSLQPRGRRLRSERLSATGVMRRDTCVEIARGPRWSALHVMVADTEPIVALSEEVLHRLYGCQRRLDSLS